MELLCMEMDRTFRIQLKPCQINYYAYKLIVFSINLIHLFIYQSTYLQRLNCSPYIAGFPKQNMCITKVTTLEKVAFCLSIKHGIIDMVTASQLFGYTVNNNILVNIFLYTKKKTVLGCSENIVLFLYKQFKFCSFYSKSNSAPYKAAAVRPSTTHHENYQN